MQVVYLPKSFVHNLPGDLQLPWGGRWSLYKHPLSQIGMTEAHRGMYPRSPSYIMAAQKVA